MGGWDKAGTISQETTIRAPDAIHLITAILAGCDILVTTDGSFIGQANDHLKKKNLNKKLVCCEPDNVFKQLTALGFSI